MGVFSARKGMVATAIAATVAVGAGGAAFAYFTATGEGTGSASVGTSTPWQVTVPIAIPALYPGAGPVPVTFLAANTGLGVQTFSNAVITVEDADEAPGAAGECQTSWFTQAGPTVIPPVTVNPGATGTGVVLLQMNNEPVNQDACQGATLDIKVVVS